jgi:hypothetical protein
MPVFLRANSNRPPPNTLTPSTSSGTVSTGFAERAGDLGRTGVFVYRFDRASVPGLSEKMTMDIVGPVAVEDRIEIKSIFLNHDLCLIGNVNAMPGYDRT